MIIHFEKDGKQFEGKIEDDIYYEMLFPIFRDYLKPVGQKKFFTIEEAKEHLAKTQTRRKGLLGR